MFGYGLSLLPLAGSLLIVLYYWLGAPPQGTPNITLRGTEIIFPILLGILIALIYLLRIPFVRRECRKTLWIQAGFALSPLCLLLIFLRGIVPLLSR